MAGAAARACSPADVLPRDAGQDQGEGRARNEAAHKAFEVRAVGGKEIPRLKLGQNEDTV